MSYKLRAGDCLPYLRSLPDKSIDAIVTDPPYGIDIANNPFRQKFEKDEWDSEPVGPEYLSEILRVSRYQIIWGGNYFELPVHKNFLIWDKLQSQDFSSSMCEQAWTNLDLPAKLFRFAVTSYKKYHPTQKPVPLMKWCLAFLPDDCRTILDPFMGVGTTGIAAVASGLDFIGWDKDLNFVAVASKLVGEAAQSPLLFDSLNW